VVFAVFAQFLYDVHCVWGEAHSVIWLGHSLQVVLHLVRLFGMAVAMSVLAPADFSAQLLPSVLVCCLINLTVHAHFISRIAQSSAYPKDVRVARTVLATMLACIQSFITVALWWRSGVGYWANMRSAVVAFACLRLAFVAIFVGSIGTKAEVYPPGNLTAPASCMSSLGLLSIAYFFSSARRPRIAAMIRPTISAIYHRCRPWYSLRKDTYAQHATPSPLCIEPNKSQHRKKQVSRSHNFWLVSGVGFKPQADERQPLCIVYVCSRTELRTPLPVLRPPRYTLA
jgi:hypothetical protein